MKHELVIATNNLGKAREFKDVFAAAGWQIKTLNDFDHLPQVRETGHTFAENARLKADHFAKLLQQPVLADDSGLEVDYLHGAPGIRSARYAGDHDDAANNARLLAELGGLAPERRTANFHTTLVLAWPDRPANDLVINGDVPGQILSVPRGDDGFGYDPLFYLPALAKTFAEMNPTEKNKYSHRGAAIKNLLPVWQQWWQEQEQVK
jgi:non-canonical purine NTP pyrophosphatase (RdgB/HAM1 family)